MGSSVAQLYLYRYTRNQTVAGKFEPQCQQSHCVVSMSKILTYLPLSIDSTHAGSPRDMTEFCLFDLILYVPSTIFQLNRDGTSWVEPVLS